MRSNPFSTISILRLSRRALLGLIGRAAALASFFGIAARSGITGAETPAVAGLSDQELNTLAGMIFELFPHQGLPQDYYLKTARAVMDRAAGDVQSLQAGIADLESACGGAGWAGAKEATRLAAMKKLEDRPFFQFVRSSGIELIYRDPQLWDVIGYGGNALKRGGYLQHGFNDIDWLPPAGKS